MGGVIHNTGDVPDARTARAAVSTGRLPTAEAVRTTLEGVRRRFQEDREGQVPDYIPELAEVDPELFGIAVAHVSGAVYAVGDADHPFSIQSVSKPFVFALVSQELGRDTVRTRIGVNSTGLPFNSVLAVELNHGSPMNRSYSVSRSGSWTHAPALRTSRTVLGVLVARVLAASGGTDRVRGPGMRGRGPSRPGAPGAAWTVRCPCASLWCVRGGAVRRRIGCPRARRPIAIPAAS